MNSSSASVRPASTALRQFIKFCIVGVCNLAIDYSVSYVLHYHFQATIELAKIISFIVAVSNSFYWNSRWTFRVADRTLKKRRYILFVAINIVGLALNLLVVKTTLWFMTGTLVDQHPTKTQFAITTLLAAIVVASWNFGANKRWTFKA